MKFQRFLLFAAAVSLSAPATAALVAAPPLFAPGDESIATTSRTIRMPTATLQYQSRAGRLPIRNTETGEVRGRVYFSAYVMPSTDGQPRPITFLWNGGPSVNSLLLHTEMFGPRRIEGDRFVDNLETLLTVSDLVFYDPVGTGFSRPESAEAAAEFYSVLGDFAATAEFIRAYRARFGAERQPLFLAGESYGTWRAGGVAERLAAAEIDVDGIILISGGIPGSQMPYAFSDAMFVPARTAAAFHHRRLPADLMANRAVTIRQAADWSRTVYLPALERIETLGEEEREAIARNLARFTGLRPELIDRATLVVPNRDFLRLLHEGDSGRRLDTFDMRRFAGEAGQPGRRETIGGYFRRELGYATDLNYAGLEPGYTPEPGPAARSPSQLWSYNHVEITPEMLARAQAGGGPPGSQPWLQNAMRANRELRVFVAAGRFDSLNMCEGNEAIVARLEADLARRFTTRCYEGGHMMYRDVEERRALARDVRQFVVAAMEEQE